MRTPFLACLLFSFSSYASAQTLCTPDEQVFFSCPVGKKIVSLCTTADKMSYRFGTPKKIEMTFSGGATDRKFSRIEVSGASNSSRNVSFTNQGVNYTLYSPARGGPGLNVDKDGVSLAHMECKSGWSSTQGDPDQPSSFITDNLKR
jgi:hypothetical protein